MKATLGECYSDFGGRGGIEMEAYEHASFEENQQMFCNQWDQNMCI